MGGSPLSGMKTRVRDHSLSAANVLRSRECFSGGPLRVDTDDGAILLPARESHAVGECHGTLTQRKLGARRDDYIDSGNVDLDLFDHDAQRTGDTAQIGFEFFLEVRAQAHVIAKKIGGEMPRQRCGFLHLAQDDGLLAFEGPERSLRHVLADFGGHGRIVGADRRRAHMQYPVRAQGHFRLGQVELVVELGGPDHHDLRIDAGYLWACLVPDRHAALVFDDGARTHLRDHHIKRALFGVLANPEAVADRSDSNREDDRNEVFQHTSNNPAAPMPPPMHMVTTTSFAPRRLPSISACPVRRAPVMPYGWPTAIAPPFTLRRSFGMPRRSAQYSTWTAKASLSSQRSISAMV